MPALLIPRASILKLGRRETSLVRLHDWAAAADGVLHPRPHLHEEHNCHEQLRHTGQLLHLFADGAGYFGAGESLHRPIVGGNYSHTSFLNVATFNPTYARDNGKVQFSTPGAMALKSFFCAAYGFEGFAKTASESGINVSDRALPVTCEIDRQPIGNAAGALNPAGVGQDANGNIRYDIWAMTDLILYTTMDAQMSTRI